MVNKHIIVVVLVALVIIMGVYLATKDKTKLSIMLENYDTSEHEVSLMILDQNNNVILNQTQLLQSPAGTKLYEGVITKKGIYIVNVTVDNNANAIEKVDLDEKKILKISITQEGIEFGYVMS